VEHLIFSMKFGKKSYNLDIPERAACFEALFNKQTYNSSDADESVRNMVDRYADIEEQFPESLKGPALPYFIDWLLERVELVEIAANSDDDAYLIFETMNDRGRPLSPTDMLKGYLLTNIADPSARASGNLLWKRCISDIRKLTEEEEAADFLKHWLRAKYARNIRERKRGADNLDFERIGGGFHKWVRDERRTLGLKTSADYNEFVHSLFPRYAQHYLRVRKAAEVWTPDLEVVFYNAHNNFTLQYLLLLAPLRPDDDEEIAMRKIHLVATYIDILVARRAVNYLTLNYSAIVYTMFNLAKDIRDLSVSKLRALLKNRINQLGYDFSGTEDGTRGGCDEFGLNQWSKRYVRHILARITTYLETQCGMPNRFAEYVSREIKKPFEIEHILADKFERHRGEFKDKEDFTWHRQLIGGLVLVPRGFNQSYGDMPYERKLRHYLQQNILCQSLHNQCYEKNPSFTRVIERSRLPFRPLDVFRREELTYRQALYKRLCEAIWSPARLDSD